MTAPQAPICEYVNDSNHNIITAAHSTIVSFQYTHVLPDPDDSYPCSVGSMVAAPIRAIMPILIPFRWKILILSLTLRPLSILGNCWAAECFTATKLLLVTSSSTGNIPNTRPIGPTGPIQVLLVLLVAKVALCPIELTFDRLQQFSCIKDQTIILWNQQEMIVNKDLLISLRMDTATASFHGSKGISTKPNIECRQLIWTPSQPDSSESRLDVLIIAMYQRLTRCLIQKLVELHWPWRTRRTLAKTKDYLISCWVWFTSILEELLDVEYEVGHQWPHCAALNWVIIEPNFCLQKSTLRLLTAAVMR